MVRCGRSDARGTARTLLPWRQLLMRMLPRFAFLFVLAGSPALAQSPAGEAPQTREAVIEAERGDKLAELWPARQSAMVDAANRLVERGFKEGLESGKGANGFQWILGGMRADQGLSGGIGYRRSDLLHEQFGIRGTARGSTNGGYMLDLDLDFQGLRTERTFLRWYTKVEDSPQINYFGVGNKSLEADRASYQYRDASSDFNASYAPARNFRVGATGGYFKAHTGQSGEEGLPPIDEVFPPEKLPGFGEDTQYTRFGVFGYFDSRDSQTGPQSGGLLGARYREYWDVARKEFAFRQAELEVQKYVPYFNRSRVIAVRGSVVLSFPKKENAVPLYLQPTIGGSDDLRGFVPYRFTDAHAVKLSAEYRWHAFSYLDMSLFGDAGKVVPLKRDIDVSRLHYAGGIGFRVRLRSAVVTRIDLAESSEGFRMIWTFSDIFNPKF